MNSWLNHPSIAGSPILHPCFYQQKERGYNIITQLMKMHQVISISHLTLFHQCNCNSSYLIYEVNSEVHFFHP